MLSSLLPVLDDIDRAREHGELEGGFKAVAESLERIVAAQGLVTSSATPGDEFDPAAARGADALLPERDDHDLSRTSSRPGYRVGDRVVRPARVSTVGADPTSRRTWQRLTDDRTTSHDHDDD